jgi:hypothetical protein
VSGDVADLARRVRALEQARGARIGGSWRLVEDYWPDTASPLCALVQMHKDGDWTTVVVISPDGTMTAV